MKSVLVALLLVLAFAMHPADAAAAGPTCPDPGAGKIFSSICVSCMFPITIAAIPIGGDGDAGVPIGADMDPVCFCHRIFGVIPIPGVTVGMWIPKRVIETVRNPYCSPTLGGNIGGSSGSVLDSKAKGLLGGDGTSDYGGGETEGFHNTHIFMYPIGEIIGSMVTTACLSAQASSSDLVYVSELDPSWNNDQMSELMTPEASLFANPLAVAACIPDAVASTFYQPIPYLFWCMGAWGTAYPFDGQTTTSDAVTMNSLVAAKATARMQRFGLILQTMGPAAVCEPFPNPILVKNQYKFQQLYPFPETTSDHWMGASANAWGEWRHAPVTGEDYVTLEWQFVNCCLY